MSLAPMIWALDVASKTGVCEGRAGEIPRMYSKRFARDDDEHEDVFARALQWILDRTNVDVPDYIYIEAPLSIGAASGQTNANTLLRLNGLWATLAAAVKVKGVAYRRARVGEIRKVFIGSGVYKGPEAKDRCFETCKRSDVFILF